MADFNISIKKLLAAEGGLSTDPDDPGGITNFGIALNRHPELTENDIRTMTRERAVELYKESYWTSFLDQVKDQAVADYLFDIRVNQGAGTELTILMRSLNALSAVYVDSGADLIALTNGALAVRLLSELRAQRALVYHGFLLSHPKENKDALGLFRRACK